MFYKISTWALMLTAVSNVLASPISQSDSTPRAEAEAVGSCSIPCPPGEFCVQVVCGGGYCPLPDCANCPDCYAASKRSPAEAPLADRQLDCPPDVDCSPPIQCNPDTCDFPACADAEVCQNEDRKRGLENRQFECPPGVPCGHGPVCTAQLCDLPGCADADVCQNNNDKDRKRNAETDLADRNCNICREGDDGVLVCGCECSADLCHDPSCANSDVCQENKRLRRSAQSETSCDCSGHPSTCACAIEYREEPKRRERGRVCHQYCIKILEYKNLCRCDA